MYNTLLSQIKLSQRHSSFPSQDYGPNINETGVNQARIALASKNNKIILLMHGKLVSSYTYLQGCSKKTIHWNSTTPTRKAPKIHTQH